MFRLSSHITAVRRGKSKPPIWRTRPPRSVRPLLAAAVPRDRASRVERASRWRVTAVRGPVRQRDPAAPAERVRIGRGRDERGSVRMQRPAGHLARGPLFDDAAQIEDRDPVGDARDDGHVVGDEEIRQAGALPQLEEADSRSARRSDTSSAETGSSQTTRRGRVASALAIATRWRWPPESSAGKREASSGDNPTSARRPPTRSRSSFPRARFCTRRGSPTWSPTCMRGFSEDCGS